MDEGANVRAWDEVGTENFKKHFPDRVIYCNTIEEALIDADLCFILTEWDTVKQLPLNKYKELMKNPVVLDGRNCYSLEDARSAGIKYNSVGRPVIR